MRSGMVSLALGVVLALAGGATASRVCGDPDAEDKPTYEWALREIRYQGAAPGEVNGTANYTAEVSPVDGSAVYSCSAEWPEWWLGWFENGSNSLSDRVGNLIWTDCVSTGDEPELDDIVSLALDWDSRTVFITHTFNCTNDEDAEGLGQASWQAVDFSCTPVDEESGGREECMLAPGSAPRLVASWQQVHERVDGWTADRSAPFTIRNLLNTDAFACRFTDDDGTTGDCDFTLDTMVPTEAVFSFDAERNVLSIEQIWKGCICEGIPMSPGCVRYVDISDLGKAYVQPGTAGTIWVGEGTRRTP
ncbi:hypothetical protein GGR52DRAFT_573690 [Hypoxylon sp. FL1284]|nr:hypothetical protein GGR52DRAFT_573690 [Hypoxylon sp. FL1284]